MGLSFSEILIFFKFDSAQCYPARRHLLRDYLRENEFEETYFNLFIREPDGFD